VALQSGLEICWSQVCDERSWSTDLQQTTVRFRRVFGGLLGSSTVMFGPAVNLLTEG
jgi:hypothetical protein